MAGQDRAQAHDLIDWPALAGDLPRAGLFGVLRRAEATDAAKPRIGKARRPEQSIIDLAQQPVLGFAQRTLADLEMRRGRPQLRGYWLGLTGPMGPLPAHISEFAWFERRHADKTPFNDWLDLISNRMLQLFYRAWAEAQPAAHADRADDDGFARWLGALSGAMEGTDAHDSFFARARVHYAPLFAGSRSATAIEDALSHLLGHPAKVLEYRPRWRALENEDLSRLGRSFSTLGSDAALGGRVYSAADAFRVVVRARNFADYRSLLPGGARFSVAAEAISAFVPSHLEWDLCVELDEIEAPAARLDTRGRLGWSSWVKKPTAKPAERVKRRRAAPISATDRVRSDAHLRKTSISSKRTPNP